MVDVPSTIGGNPVLGWELRVSNWVGATPTVVIQARLVAQWHEWDVRRLDEVRGRGGWEPPARTFRYKAVDPCPTPGTYYIGFYNGTGSNMTSCQLTSRAVGEGMSYSPASISFDGGLAVITNLAPRDVAYYYVDIPSNQPSLEG